MQLHFIAYYWRLVIQLFRTPSHVMDSSLSHKIFILQFKKRSLNIYKKFIVFKLVINSKNTTNKMHSHKKKFRLTFKFYEKINVKQIFFMPK